VGDTLRVTLRNLVPGHNVTLHPHGVLYTKSSEGSPYIDGTSGAAKADDGVKTGAPLLQWRGQAPAIDWMALALAGRPAARQAATGRPAG
jgi:FtsP/CotA-like multicopper oxidase with cupredoxin domain